MRYFFLSLLCVIGLCSFYAVSASATMPPLCEEAPKCSVNQTLTVTEQDYKGCPVYKCIAVEDCPAYFPPECGKDEILTSVMTNGCPRPVCVAKPECPQYQRPICPKGEEVAVGKDANGCTKPVCQPVQECPQYQRPLCKSHENVVTVQDKNGCAMPVCKSKLQCPDISRPRCSKGQIVKIAEDENGCKTAECVTSDNDVKCSSLIPSCRRGQTVQQTGEDRRGCPTFKCVYESASGSRSSGGSSSGSSRNERPTTKGNTINAEDYKPNDARDAIKNRDSVRDIINAN